MGRRTACIPGEPLEQNETETTLPWPGSKFCPFLRPHPAKNHSPPRGPQQGYWGKGRVQGQRQPWEEQGSQQQ